MNVGLYRGAVAMQLQMRRLDSISSNLANLGVSGYKRVGDASRSFEVQGPHGRVWGQQADRSVDFAQGSLERTGRHLDLALQGPGFFAVEAPEGERYTRDGEFQLTPDGNLVTTQGWPVAWDVRDGLIDPTAEPLAIDADGNVRQGLNEIGRLRVVDFEDQQALLPGGRGTWRAPAGLAEATAEGAVHQDALEESNATAVSEMVAMVETQRQFDVLSRTVAAIQELDQRLMRSS